MTGTELKNSLRSLGWKQSDLAERLGVDLATVSRWANGHLPVPKYASAYLGLALKLRDFSTSTLDAL